MMTSPFPGMDPYLEEPSMWSSVHVRMMNAISDALSPLITPHFFVEIQQHVYIANADDLPGGAVIPDVYLIHTPSRQGGPAIQQPVVEVTPPTLVEPLVESEIRQHFIEIRDRRNREVVTVIEILSPFNKSAGALGERAFRAKRSKIFGSPVNWLEIDLLRAGSRPPEVSGKSDYYVLLKRGDRLFPFEVWYFDLRDRLPVVATPLREPFDDAALDLGDVIRSVYERARYGLVIDYSRPVPSPRLRPADENWASERIAAWKGQQL